MPIFLVREKGLEPSRLWLDTGTSSLPVYLFQHSRLSSKRNYTIIFSFVKHNFLPNVCMAHRMAAGNSSTPYCPGLRRHPGKRDLPAAGGRGRESSVLSSRAFGGPSRKQARERHSRQGGLPPYAATEKRRYPFGDG